MTASENRRQRREFERLNAIEHYRTGKLSPDTIDIYLRRWLLKLNAIALTRREWSGLPETIDQRYLEKILLRDGRAIIYGGDSAPIAAATGELSNWDEQENTPRAYAIGANGEYSEELNELNSVIIYDNMARVPINSEIYNFARDLAIHDMEIMKNVLHQNSFFMLSVPRAMKSDGEKIMRNFSTGTPGMLVASDGLDAAEVKTLSTGITPIMDKLNESKDHLFNEFSAFIGLDHIPNEKRERLTVDEAQIYEDITQRQKIFFLHEAEKAAERMNGIFSWGVSVKWRE